MPNKDPIVCPLTGKPCLIPKIIKVTDVHKDGGFKTTHLCHLCSGTITKQSGKEFDEFLKETKLEASPEAAQAFSGLMTFLDNIAASSTPPDQPPSKLMPASQIPDKEPCPQCGCTLMGIIKSERLGCPACYIHFQRELQGIILTVQDGGIKHVGKVPKQWQKMQEELHTVEKLEKKLAEAIKAEDYEQAAQIRDLLKDYNKDDGAK